VKTDETNSIYPLSNGDLSNPIINYGRMYIGSYFHPNWDLIIELARSFKKLTTYKDREISHNAKVSFAAYLYCLINGIRTFEYCRLKASQIDLLSGIIPVIGKSNQVRENSRYLPLIKDSKLFSLVKTAYLASQKCILDKALIRHENLVSDMAFYFVVDGVIYELTVNSLQKFLDFAADQAGIKADTIFDFTKTRHLAKSSMVEFGLPSELINAIMGHQPIGLETFSNYRDSNLLRSGLDQYARYAHWQSNRILKSLGD